MLLQNEYFPFIMIGLTLSFLCAIIYSDVQANTQTRQENFNNIDGAKNCIELQAYYLKAIDFESDFSNNGFAVKVTAHEQAKARELNCN